MIALAAIALPAASIAQTPRCVTQDQAASLVTFALPSLIEGVAQRCERAIGPSAYLTINATALARRYQPDADAAWPLARRTIAGFFEPLLGQPMPEDMNSDVLRILLEPIMGKLLAKAVNIGDCGMINAAITQAAPLPGHNLGELAAMAAMIADKKDKGLAGVLHICRLEPHP